MSNIVVIGSANMDTTHYLNCEFPLYSEGENSIKESVRVLGGKGTNQAVATKLQGPNNEVFFIGCVGEDTEGLKIIENLKERNINYSGVKVLKGLSTDGRIITVDTKGENKMMGYGDCIKQLTPDVLKEKENLLLNADIILIQMKMPAETVKYVVDYCRNNHKTLLIDPTPPEKSSVLLENDLEMLKSATYLTPNEEEAFALAQYIYERQDYNDSKKLYKELSREEVLEKIFKLVSEYPNIIATIGDKGVIYNNGTHTIIKPTYPTECKDSTGAGDTFNGAFTAAIARGETLEIAIEYALKASSEKVQHNGAQNGIPTFARTNSELNKLKGNGR